MSSPIINNSYLDSLRCSFRGLWWSLSSERNSLLFTIQSILGLVACAIFGAPAWCWAAVGFIWAGALATEMLNTVAERIVDKFGEGRIEEDTRLIKDLAAGAVMPWGMLFVALIAYIVISSPILSTLLRETVVSFVTLIPVMLGGMTNMLILKRTDFLSHLAVPIDGGHVVGDGRRLFGDNKTWRGVATMTISCAVWQVVFDALLRYEGLAHMSHLAPCVPDGMPAFLFDLLVGALLGLVYMLCELPNSYVKRRMGVSPGGGSQEGSPRRRMLLFGLDHIDSSIGGCLVVCAVARLGVPSYLLYLVVSFLMHVGANLLLRRLRLRSSM